MNMLYAAIILKMSIIFNFQFFSEKQNQNFGVKMTFDRNSINKYVFYV